MVLVLLLLQTVSLARAASGPPSPMDCGPNTRGQKYTYTVTATDYVCTLPNGWAYVRVIGAMPPRADTPVFGVKGIIAAAFSRAPVFACNGKTLDLAGYRVRCVPSGTVAP